MNRQSRLSPNDWLLLSAYLDGELSRSEKERLEQRLQRVAELQRAYQELLRSRAVLHALPRRRAPRNFTIAPALAGQKTPGRSLLFPAMSFSSALSLLLLVLTFFFQPISRPAALTANDAQVLSAPMESVAANEDGTPAPLIIWEDPNAYSNKVAPEGQGMGGGEMPAPSVSDSLSPAPAMAEEMPAVPVDGEQPASGEAPQPEMAAKELVQPQEAPAELALPTEGIGEAVVGEVSPMMEAVGTGEVPAAASTQVAGVSRDESAQDAVALPVPVAPPGAVENSGSILGMQPTVEESGARPIPAETRTLNPETMDVFWVVIRLILLIFAICSGGAAFYVRTHVRKI